MCCSITRTCLIVVSLCFGIGASTHAKIIYVDDDATGAADGSSWAHAYRFLQDALADANDSAKPVEVRVAQGVYRPDANSAHPDGTGDRRASFHLLDGVAIMGGFAGVSAPDPNVRDIALYETVLSGDLEGDDAVVLDPCDLLIEPARAENSCTVVEAGACSRSTVLDGFTITSGSVFVPCTRRASGGGLYVSGDYDGEFACPSIRNCTFVGNIGHHGGAVDVVRGYPEFLGCTFRQNAAAELGGAVFAHLKDSPPENTRFLIKECTFDDNCAGIAGGAVHVWHSERSSSGVIEGCSFTGNVALSGGAIYTRDTRTTILETGIRNSRFIHNRAHEAGGAIYITSERGLDMSLSFCTLFGNVAGVGSAVACLEPSLEGYPAPSVTIVNTILRGADDEIGVTEHVQMHITYSDIHGGWPGEGNIDVDPLFADPNNGDHHLKSEAGRWDPASMGWVLDDVTSPCIDAGDPNSPIGYEPFPNGGRVNMGAYGGTAEASKSPSGLHGKYGGGAGEPNDPYLIYTAEHLSTIGAEPNDWDKHFKLMADIDLSVLAEGAVRNAGSSYSTPFNGTFDGDGHVIRNLTITNSSGKCIGLFGTLGRSGQLKDLDLADARVIGHTYVGALVGYNAGGTIHNCSIAAEVQGVGYIGGIAGISIDDGLMSDCRADVRVLGQWYETGGIAGANSGSTITRCAATGTVTGQQSTGGVVGRQDGWSLVSDSFSTCSVTGGRWTGGVLGRNAYSMVSGCFATGDVSGVQGVGGLVGFSDAEVSDCWAGATVSGELSVGGLIGENVYGFVLRCYSRSAVAAGVGKGGLIGSQQGRGFYDGCFYDCDVDVLPPAVVDATGIYPKPSVELMMQRTYTQAGWDFVDETENGTDDTWWILEGQDYPRLWWELGDETSP